MRNSRIDMHEAMASDKIRNAASASKTSGCESPQGPPASAECDIEQDRRSRTEAAELPDDSPEYEPKSRGVRLSCPRCGAACTIEHLAARPECDKHIKSLAAIRSRSKRRVNSRAGGARPGNKNAVKPKPEPIQEALGGAK